MNRAILLLVLCFLSIVIVFGNNVHVSVEVEGNSPHSVRNHHDARPLHRMKQQILPAEAETDDAESEADIDEAEFDSAVDEEVSATASASTLGKGFDYSYTPAISAIPNLKKAGITFVGRYFSGGNSKDIKSAESKALLAEGIQIIIAAEGTGQEVRQGFNGGVKQAKTVLAQANENGVPSDVVFYFAVDFDLTASQTTLLGEYLKGIASVVGINRTGVYGGYRVANYAVTNKLVAQLGDCYAVWQAFAWSSGKWQAGVTVRQTKNDQKVAGIDGDLDTAMCPEIGGWHK